MTIVVAYQTLWMLTLFIACNTYWFMLAEVAPQIFKPPKSQVVILNKKLLGN